MLTMHVAIEACDSPTEFGARRNLTVSMLALYLFTRTTKISWNHAGFTGEPWRPSVCQPLKVAYRQSGNRKQVTCNSRFSRGQFTHPVRCGDAIQLKSSAQIDPETLGLPIVAFHYEQLPVFVWMFLE